MKKYLKFFSRCYEKNSFCYAKGSDKGFDGFRPDSKPILNARKDKFNLKI